MSTYPPKKLFQHLWYQILVIFGWVQSPFSAENIRSSLESNLIIPGLMAEFPVLTQVYGSQGRGLLSFSVPYRETPVEKCIVWYVQGQAWVLNLSMKCSHCPVCDMKQQCRHSMKAWDSSAPVAGFWPGPSRQEMVSFLLTSIPSPSEISLVPAFCPVSLWFCEPLNSLSVASLFSLYIILSWSL